MSKYIGLTGTTQTDMRPGGKITIDGETFDAVAINGSFIEEGCSIKVEKFENSQLYVLKINAE